MAVTFRTVTFSTTTGIGRKAVRGGSFFAFAIFLLTLGAFCLTPGKPLMAQSSANGTSGSSQDHGRHHGWRHHRRPWPKTTNRIIPFSDQIDTGAMTEAQFRFAATHYAGTQKVTAAAARHLRRYNPNFLIMHYRLAEMLGYGSCDANGDPTGNNLVQIIDGDWTNEWPGDSVVQPNWFYYYDGSKVYECSQKHYLMNIADPGWRQWYSTQVIKELKDNEDDAVFADSFSVPDEWQDWKPNLDYATWLGSGPPNLESQWSAMIHDFTNYMRRRLHGRWLWIPNVGSWITGRDITDYTNVDGAMIEDFADRGNENYFATGDWVLQMNRALSLINLDKILIAQSYPAPWVNNTDAINERLFITGSYLLIKGRHTYLNLDAQGGQLTGLLLQWWPEYQIDLGPPTDPLPQNISQYWNANWGVYVRHYAKGMVLVNPTNAADGVSPIPINLDKTYYEVVNDGNGGLVPADGSTPGTLSYQAVKGLTVCSDCAAILLKHPPHGNDR